MILKKGNSLWCFFCLFTGHWEDGKHLDWACLPKTDNHLWNKTVLHGETGKEKFPQYYKIFVWASRCPRRPLRGTTLTRNALLLVMSPSEGGYFVVWWRTTVIRWAYLHYIWKYNCFEKYYKNMSVHLSPCFRDDHIGNTLTVGECQPLSKTVCFSVLKVTKDADTKKWFQKFWD